MYTARYLYRTAQPPVPAVLAAVQTGLAAAILCVLCGTWFLISNLRRRLKSEAVTRGPRRTLSDTEAPRREDSALNVKQQEVRACSRKLRVCGCLFPVNTRYDNPFVACANCQAWLQSLCLAKVPGRMSPAQHCLWLVFGLIVASWA